MKNKEKYANEIVDIACSGKIVAVNKYTGEIVGCLALGCKNCFFGDSNHTCIELRNEWAEAEYKEPITRDRLEKEYIRFLETKNGIAHQSVTKYLSETKYYCSMCLEWLLDHYNVTEKEAENG